MNCCDDYGQCKQCHGCPCRTSYTPEALRAAQEPNCSTDWLSIALWVMLGFAIAAVLGLNLGYWLHA